MEENHFADKVSIPHLQRLQRELGVHARVQLRGGAQVSRRRSSPEQPTPSALQMTTCRPSPAAAAATPRRLRRGRVGAGWRRRLRRCPRRRWALGCGRPGRGMHGFWVRLGEGSAAAAWQPGMPGSSSKGDMSSSQPSVSLVPSGRSGAGSSAAPGTGPSPDPDPGPAHPAPSAPARRLPAERRRRHRRAALRPRPHLMALSARLSQGLARGSGRAADQVLAEGGGVGLGSVGALVQVLKQLHCEPRERDLLLQPHRRAAVRRGCCGVCCRRRATCAHMDP